MGSPLGLVLANIFMIGLETSVISNQMIKQNYGKNLDNILLALNSVYKGIKFAIEIKKDNTIPCLDTLIRTKPGQIETAVYSRKTCTNLYVN